MPTVSCFFQPKGCGHQVRHIDPKRAHDLMEVHYEAAHVTDMIDVLGGPKPRTQRVRLPRRDRRRG